MKRLLVLISTLAISLPALADRSGYHDCLLHHLQGAKLDNVTTLIKKACEENHLGSTRFAREDRAYNECLLQYLEGVESPAAVVEIQVTCREKHR